MTDPLNATLPPGPHGLSAQFVAENQRTRLATGFGHVVREKGYSATSVAAVCKAASVSQRTFYEHFDNKKALANAVMVKALAKSYSMDSGIGVFIVETIARVEAEPDLGCRECDLLEELLARVHDIEEPAEAPLPARVPSPLAGPRPRLSEDFIASSQRDRIVAAVARCLVKRRWVCVTVADIVSETKTARNTFYARFPNKEAAARGMVESISPEMAEWLAGLSFDAGLGAVAVELIAHRIVGGQGELSRASGEIKGALRLLRDAVDA